MIYTTGTVNVVEGSRTVIGVGTSFIKYVDVGALFKIVGDFDYYSVIQITDDLTLLLDRNYSSETKSLQQFSINPDRTPNLNLPLVGRNDPDAARTVNIALGMIDRNAGNMMDFTTLVVYTASGEKHGFVYNDYHDTFLEEGRVVAFQNASGETVGFNRVLHNTLFDAQINIAPSGENVFYDGGSLSGTVPKKWDILSNLDSYGYAFIKSAVFGINSGEVAISGEIMHSDGVWDNNDRIAVFGQTYGLGKIQSVSPSGETVVALSGETLSIANFVVGTSIYNYTRNNSRTIVRSTGSVIGNFGNNVTIDDWAIGDIVYTLKQKLEFEITGVPITASVIQYGAKSNISVDGVKKEHIDFGTGFNQVGASDLPIDLAAIPETNTQEAIHYAYDAFVNHTVSGEAHFATAIHYQDDLQGDFPMLAINANDAINELKARVNAGVILNGTISSGESKTGFFCADFISTPTDFISGEWWCRFENGSAIGNVRKVVNFNSLTGHFTVSGECQYIPETNSDFLLMNINKGDLSERVLTKEIKTNTATPTDLTIVTGTEKTMVLETPVYDDIIIQAINLRVGSSPPTFDAFTANIFGLRFINGNTDLVYGSFEIPHNYKEGTDLEIHLHWSPNSTNTGNCVWNFVYSLASMGTGVFGTEATLTMTQAGSGTALKHQYVSGNTLISGTNIKIGNIVIFALSRPSGDAFTGDAFLHSVGCHYQIDTLGSRTMGNK